MKSELRALFLVLGAAALWPSGSGLQLATQRCVKSCYALSDPCDGNQTRQCSGCPQCKGRALTPGSSGAKEPKSAAAADCPVPPAAERLRVAATVAAKKAKTPLGKKAALLELRTAIQARVAQAPEKKPVGGIPFDGMFEVGCFIDDTSEASWSKYEELVPKEDRKPVTPEVCFDFCRTQPGALFFGLLEGRKCYCTPYPTLSAGAGGQDQCEEVCEGNKAVMCGGMTKSTIYEMHRCGDTLSDAEEVLEKAKEQVKAAEELSKQTDLIVSAMDKASDHIFVTQIRALIQADTRAYAGLIAEVGNRMKDAGPVVDDLDAKVKAADPATLTPEQMKEIEQAQREATEKTAELRTAFEELEGFHKEHDAVHFLKWHSLPSLEAYAEMAKKPNPYAPPQYGRAVNLMPPEVVEKIGCDDRPADGCEDFDGDLIYFVVEDADETAPLEPLYEFVTPKIMGPLGLTEKQPYAWARLQCVDLCRMTFGCVGGNVIGANTAGGGAFRCGLKSNIKKVELAVSKQANYDVSIGGFIFRDYYDLHKKEISFNTARITTEQ